jgi:recombination protein RecT
MSTELVKPDNSMGSLLSVLNDSNASTQARAGALSKMVDIYQSDISAILPKHVDFHRMKQLFVLSVKNMPKLLDCEPASLVKALFTAASMGLEPDPHFGQVYLLPYGKQVQVIPGYKGLLQLVRNSGEITSISAQVVCQNDEFEYDLASGERPKHKPALTGRGEAVAYYCIANFRDGGFHFELMTKDDIEKIRVRSAAVKAAAKHNKQTPWDTDYDEMAKKTVVRRAVKRLPISLTRQARTALVADDAYNSGKQFEIDKETGEAIDIWAEPVEEAPAPTPTRRSSRLESFAGDATPAETVSAEVVTG